MFVLSLAARPMLELSLVQLKTVPATVPEKFTAVVVAPLQSAWSAGSATVGVGFTVIVKVCAVPGQLLAVGVTVTVEVIGVVPVLMAEKDAMFVLPEAAKPVLVLSFVQLKTVPATVPEKFTAVVATPLQSAWSAGSATVGVGFTVIVKF